MGARTLTWAPTEKPSVTSPPNHLGSPMGLPNCIFKAAELHEDNVLAVVLCKWNTRLVKRCEYLDGDLASASCVGNSEVE